MFATVELNAEIESSALLVPDSAVLRSGEKNTVFVVLGNGHFEPREVTLGPRGENNTYEVLSGLKEGERVVTSGQFMKRIATPMVGGIVTSTLMELLVFPAIYFIWRSRQLKDSAAHRSNAEALAPYQVT